MWLPIVSHVIVFSDLVDLWIIAYGVRRDEVDADHAARVCEMFVYSIVKIWLYDYQTWQTFFLGEIYGVRKGLWAFLYCASLGSDWLGRQTPIIWSVSVWTLFSIQYNVLALLAVILSGFRGFLVCCCFVVSSLLFYLFPSGQLSWLGATASPSWEWRAWKWVVVF